MFTVGQTVWHVGKNITNQECRVLWISFDLAEESPVLVEVKNSSIYSRYRLIPMRRLTEISPSVKCRAKLALSLTQEVSCDRITIHTAYANDRHHAFIGSEGAEVFWG